MIVARALALGLLPLALHAAAAPRCSRLNHGAETCIVDIAAYPAARCNDGTVPAFWYRPGSGSGAATWIIWLEGGSSCADVASCAARAASKSTASLITSNGFHATAGAGILSAAQSENPALYNANTVLVHYCSSDTWAGARPAASRPFNPASENTWHFEGRAIAIAALATLPDIAPSFANASTILLGGDSAGGEGVTITANNLLPLLPPKATALLVNDAGFALDIGQYNQAAGSPYVYQGSHNFFDTSVLARLAYWHGSGDALCAAKAKTGHDRVDCYNSGYVLQSGLIPVPAFVAESQLDLAQVTLELCPALGGNCGVPHNPSSPEGIYATAFANHMASAERASDTAATFSAFSPDQYMHVMLRDNALFTTPLPFPGGSLTPQAAFDEWFMNYDTRKVYIGKGPGVAGHSLSKRCR
jgi:hypothetical protein